MQSLQANMMVALSFPAPWLNGKDSIDFKSDKSRKGKKCPEGFYPGYKRNLGYMIGLKKISFNVPYTCSFLGWLLCAEVYSYGEVYLLSI